MSDPGPVQSRIAKPRRDPALTVLMIVAGVVLLLPALCSLYFIHGDLGVPRGGGNERALIGALDIWLAICLIIGAGGVALIVRAIRGAKGDA
jgi:hypothetical protein